ncbi:MAG TPA: hypothetical protein VI298_03885 [Geobacteraceae bacterium]
MPGEERDPTEISLVVAPAQFGEFFPILLRGFHVAARVPCTVRDLLCDQFGLSPDYAATRITTIFLDGKATDDIDEALVRDRSTVALSAAMPGLVGATMRRGGFYAALRGAITHRENGDAGASQDGMVRIKLFNMLLRELGPPFLARGIFLNQSDLADFFRTMSDHFRRGCSEARVNGMRVVPASLQDGGFLPNGEPVRFSVEFGE